ncbi:hypothetical protein LA080_003962 [Diaporthe eres]|nr:hypothetical protein LA080_003962 [Diaporthe eres]
MEPEVPRNSRTLGHSARSDSPTPETGPPIRPEGSDHGSPLEWQDRLALLCSLSVHPKHADSFPTLIPPLSQPCRTRTGAPIAWQSRCLDAGNGESLKPTYMLDQSKVRISTNQLLIFKLGLAVWLLGNAMLLGQLAFEL